MLSKPLSGCLSTTINMNSPILNRRPKSINVTNSSNSGNGLGQQNLPNVRSATITRLPSLPERTFRYSRVETDEPLPPNWEARRDTHGRIFYIDHVNRTTTWNRPIYHQPNSLILSDNHEPILSANSKSQLGNTGQQSSIVGTTGTPVSLATIISAVTSTCTANSSANTYTYGSLMFSSSNIGKSDSTVHQPQTTFSSNISGVANMALYLANAEQIHRQQLDRRYQSIRRSITGRGHRDFRFVPQSTSTGLQFQTHSANVQHHPEASFSSSPTSIVSDTITEMVDSPGVLSLTQAYFSNQQAQPQQVSGILTTDSAANSQTSQAEGTVANNNDASISQPGPSTSTTLISSSGRILDVPAIRFLLRSDFFNILHLNDDALMQYNGSPTLKHMVTKIRRESQQTPPVTVSFERYQHNRDLVSLVNKFADTRKPLPRGWESKRDRSNKMFFIDHTTRSTTYIDPRLPLDVPEMNPNIISAPLIRRRGRGNSNAINNSTGQQVDFSSMASGILPVPPPRPNVASPIPGLSSSIPTQLTEQSMVYYESSVPTSYNDKVVAFLQQPNIWDILSERRSSIKNNISLRERISKIRLEGVDALRRYTNDIELIILLSLFENEIMSFVPPSLNTASSSQNRSQASGFSLIPTSALTARVAGSHGPYKRDFDAKLRNFYRKLEKNGFGQGPSKLKLVVRRDHLLEDAFNKIMSINTKKELQKSRLYISFTGEEGLDYGGPSREFFFLLSRELFNPYYGLFEYSANDQYTVQISPMSAFVDDYQEWFRFAGRVLGLALIHQYLLDAFFTRPFYKSLLKSDCDLSDLEYLDAGFHQSLMWLKENEITEMQDALDLTFSVTEEIAGQIVEKVYLNFFFQKKKTEIISLLIFRN